jgi:hypothetical protein
MPQKYEGLWPKDNLFAVYQKTASTQIQNVAIKLPFGRHVFRRFGIAKHHRSAHVARPPTLFGHAEEFTTKQANTF